MALSPPDLNTRHFSPSWEEVQALPKDSDRIEDRIDASLRRLGSKMLLGSLGVGIGGVAAFIGVELAAGEATVLTPKETGAFVGGLLFCGGTSIKLGVSMARSSWQQYKDEIERINLLRSRTE